MTRAVNIRWDTTQLDALEADLSRAPARIQFGAEKTLRRSGKLINQAMRQDASGHRFLPHLPNAVSDEMIGRYEVEIGLGPPGQGSLAHIIAYGSVNNAPVYDYTAGLRRSEPVVEEMFAGMTEDAVLGGNK